mgnify:FL=1
MLQISTFFIQNSDEATSLEKKNHENAFEYLPEAKAKTYSELLDNKTGVGCTIQLVPSEKEGAKENALIENGMNLYLLSTARRAFLEKDCDCLVSLSFNEDSPENKNRNGMIVYAILKTDNRKYIDDMLPDISKYICEKLGIEESNTEEIDNNRMSSEQRNESNKSNDDNESKKSTNESNEISNEKITKTSDALDIMPTTVLSQKQAIDNYSLNNKERNVSKKTEKVSENLKSKKVTEEDIEDIFSIAQKQEKTSNIEEFEKFELENNEENQKNEKMDSFFIEESDKNEEKLFLDEPHEIEDENETKFQKKENKEEQLKRQKETQKELLKKSSKKAPFLNVIDNYIPDSNLENKELFKTYHDVDYNIKTTASKDKIDKLFNQALSYCYQNKRSELSHAQEGSGDIKAFLNTIAIYVKDSLDLPVEDRDYFMDKIKRALFSYYILIPLINDPQVSDIKVLAPDKINVKIDGIHYSVDGLKFVDADDFLTFTLGLMRRNGAKPINGISKFTDTKFCDNYILRFDVTFPQINVSGFPVVHIRKMEKNKMMISDLIKAGMLDEKMAAYFKDKLRTSKGIVIAGPSACGKSKFLNALVEEIPFTEAGLAIQEADEIFAKNHPNIMCQHMYFGANGNVLAGMDKLGENGLVCDVKYFIIGEIKGAEARDFLRAANTGHICLCTVHTPSAEETIPRLADYVMRGTRYSMEEAERLLKDLEIIVYVDRFKIREITEVLGYDEEHKKLIYRTVYLRDYQNENGKSA